MRSCLPSTSCRCRTWGYKKSCGSYVARYVQRRGFSVDCPPGGRRYADTTERLYFILEVIVVGGITLSGDNKILSQRQGLSTLSPSPSSTLSVRGLFQRERVKQQKPTETPATGQVSSCIHACGVTRRRGSTQNYNSTRRQVRPSFAAAIPSAHLRIWKCFVLHGTRTRHSCCSIRDATHTLEGGLDSPKSRQSSHPSRRASPTSSLRPPTCFPGRPQQLPGGWNRLGAEGWCRRR